jgi:uncharacterized oxidoreductase
MKFSGKKILITGGATGIGFAVAQRFHEQNNKVIICGRREDALRAAVAKLPGLLYYTCDLEVREDRLGLFNAIAKDHPDLNILVNNAGIQNWMHITDDEFADRAHQEIAINAEAPVHLASMFMRLSSLETIMNVTSGLSFAPLAKVPVYCATKAFLHSWTLSLRHMLKEKNIDVIELIPPALNTDLGAPGIHDFAPPVSGFIDEVFQKLEAGQLEIAYGTSEAGLKAGQNEFREMFNRMNP